MKKIFLIFSLFTALSSIVCAQAQGNRALEFAGTIGSSPVTMLLHQTGSTFTGYYYYTRTQQPISLSGQDSIANQSIHSITAVVNGWEEYAENFLVRITGDSVTGKWKGKPGAAFQPVRLGVVKTAIAYNMIYRKDTVLLRPKMNDSPMATFETSTVDPTGNTPTAVFLRKKLIGDYEANVRGKDLQSTINTYHTRNIDGYLKDNREASDSEILDIPYSFNLDELSGTFLMYRSARLLVLSQQLYAYSGGAHGNYQTSYTPVDLRTNTIIRLKDVLTPQGIKALEQLLADQFRADRGLSPTDPLTEGGTFEDEIKPNENIYVTETGIRFSYAPYEIGSYATGQIDVFIPFSRLKQWVKPAYKF